MSDEVQTASKYQRFAVKRIRRADIKFASYNPRVLDPHARRKLKKSIQKNGLVETLVYNERTSTLVGGHQRLDILDELHGTPDFFLDVAVIDVDEATEKTLNVALNSTALQGDYDLDMLGRLLPDINLEDAGFSRLDVEMLFPDTDFGSMFSDANESPAVKADVAEIEKMKQTKKDAYAKGKEQESADFVLHLVFGDAAELKRARERLGVPEGDPDWPYCDGRRAFAGLGHDLETT